jgi:hypothetical protein
MTGFQPFRVGPSPFAILSLATVTATRSAHRARPIAASLAVAATLALAFAACSGANPPASSPTSANGTTGAQPTASFAPIASPMFASPVAANEPQTIHLIENATNVSQIRVGSQSGCSNTICQGDYLVGDDPLTDAVTGTEVGTLAFECFIVTTRDTLYHCPGITITLTGRGQIVFTEFYWDGVTRPETSPITGGTGEFLGATGTVTSQRGGDFVIMITK